MNDDDSFFWIYVWLGVLLLVCVVLALPPKHTHLKNFIWISIAFLVVTIGGPFAIKSSWDKYHDFDAGKLRMVKDLRITISNYLNFGPAAPAVFESILYLVGVYKLGSLWRAQYKKWRKEEPSR